MTKFFLKIVSTPTENNMVRLTPRVEYYGKRESYLSSYFPPSNDDLDLYGFGSFKAAETEKQRKEKNFKINENRFHTWTHSIEIQRRDI